MAWHQDAGLLPDGSPNRADAGQRLRDFGLSAMVNCWAPLVRATAHTGCMKCVPGTHKLGCVDHVVLGTYAAAGGETGGGGESSPASSRPGAAAAAAAAVPPVGAAPVGTYNTTIAPEIMAEHAEGAIDLECQPGDVILFSNLLFHRGGFNSSDTIRWSVDWRYQDASRPTHRQHTGHVLRVRDGTGGAEQVAAQSGADWAALSLT